MDDFERMGSADEREEKENMEHLKKELRIDSIAHIEFFLFFNEKKMWSITEEQRIKLHNAIQPTLFRLNHDKELNYKDYSHLNELKDIKKKMMIANPNFQLQEFFDMISEKIRDEIGEDGIRKVK